MTAIALAQIILQALPMITTGTEHLIAFVNATRAAAQQSGEWPAEVEATFQKNLVAAAANTDQQP